MRSRRARITERGRAEIRNSLPLFLLGQRFGVLAGRPAFDAETLPVGPQALCRILRDASATLDLNAEHKHQLYRQFDKHVMQYIGPLYEALNTYLIRQRVLPFLTYVPVRAKRSETHAAERAAKGFEERTGRDSVGGSAPASGRTSTGATPGGGGGGGGGAPAEASPGGEKSGVAARGEGVRSARTAAAGTGRRPFTAWPGVQAAPSPAQAQQDTEMFDVLRELLAGRRSLLGKSAMSGASRTGSFSGAYWPSPWMRATRSKLFSIA